MAEKKAGLYDGDQSIKPVLDALNALLSEFRKQAQTATIPPLVGNAETAVKAFQEIREALDVTTPPSSSIKPPAAGS